MDRGAFDKVVGYNVYRSHPTFKYKHPEWFWSLLHRQFNVPARRCGIYEEAYELIEEVRY